MSENKVVPQDYTEAVTGSGLVGLAKATAVKDQSAVDQAVQREYEAIVADIARESDFHFEQAEAESLNEREDELGFAGALGATLTDPALVARFEGVRENLLREVRGGMCTVAQAHAYLENIEISLLLEQEASVKV